MPHTRLGPNDLLEYDASYGVLICRDCQYAIQKSALQSHLLRHKIYRDERQQLLAYISQLDLLEPDHVWLPSPGSPPIDALPLLSGYCCTATGCSHLCASFKRMRNHQSEAHGLVESTDAASVREVTLQTFFRGTKIRYFEVTPLAGTNAAEIPLSASKVRLHADEGQDHDDEELDQDQQMSLAEMSTSLPLFKPSPGVHAVSSPVHIDLQTLTYFHHFTTATHVTLSDALGILSMHYWQTEIVSEALQQRRLMCGILAISAYHLAVSSNDIAITSQHHNRAVQLHLEFSTESGEGVSNSSGAESVASKCDTARGLQYILHCARWASTSIASDRGTVFEPVTPFNLQVLLKSLRELANTTPMFDPGIHSVDSNDAQEHCFARARRVATTTGSAELFELLSRFDQLPSLMMEAFGAPENTQDVLATLSAIRALVECSTIRFESNDLEGLWRGMTAWLLITPEHFRSMVSSESPAALVVLSYWAACFLKKAEDAGCWFLKGATDSVLHDITVRLRGCSDVVRSLVVFMV